MSIIRVILDVTVEISMLVSWMGRRLRDEPYEYLYKASEAWEYRAHGTFIAGDQFSTDRNASQWSFVAVLILKRNT